MQQKLRSEFPKLLHIRTTKVGPRCNFPTYFRALSEIHGKIPRNSKTMGPEHQSAADGFVIAMLVMMALSLGVVALLFFCMRRNAGRRDHQVDELLEEMEETESKQKQAALGDVPKPQPWERDGDWWKS